MTKTRVRAFAQEVKRGNVGNYYTLYDDGSIGEFTDCWGYVEGKTVYASVKCIEGLTIKGILEEIELQRMERAREDGLI